MKDLNFPQNQMHLLTDKFSRLIKDHQRDFERNQMRTRYILNFICAQQLLKKTSLNHSSLTLNNLHFLSRPKLISMTTYQQLIDQTLDFTFKGFFESPKQQALYLLNTMESHFSTLDENRFVKYDSPEILKEFFKNLFCNTVDEKASNVI